MAEAYKVLAQKLPAAANLEDAYTVPSSIQTVISSIVISNNGIADKFRLSIAVVGAGDDPMQYLFWDTDIAANETIPLVNGITLNDGDVIRVYSLNGTCAFNIFGTEIS